MPTHDHVLDEVEVSHRFLKRAQYESFAFDVTDGGIRVTNHSYADPSEHAYLVTVADGVPVACACPADTEYPSACKHRLAIAIREPVLEAATTAVAADGGTTMESTDEQQPTDTPEGGDIPEGCDCAELPGAFPCADCFIAGRKGFPES